MPPFLVLDLRSREEYDECHITGSLHYAAANIRHDKVTKEMFEYKNKPEHIIIVYDNDESLAPKTATSFVEKGFLNTFVLSAGLYRFGKKYSRHVEGFPPVSSQI